MTSPSGTSSSHQSIESGGPAGRRGGSTEFDRRREFAETVALLAADLEAPRREQIGRAERLRRLIYPAYGAYRNAAGAVGAGSPTGPPHFTPR